MRGSVRLVGVVSGLMLLAGCGGGGSGGSGASGSASGTGLAPATVNARPVAVVQSSGGADVPEFINSHPNLDKRMANIREISACKGLKPAEDNALRGLFLQLKTAE